MQTSKQASRMKVAPVETPPPVSMQKRVASPRPETPDVNTIEEIAQQGERALRAGDAAEARRSWQTLQQRAPHHLSTRVLGAKLAIQQGREEEASGLLQQGVAQAGQRNDLIGMLAFLLQKQGQYATAEHWYQLLVQRDKQNAAWWLGWAISLDSLERRVEAIRAYRTASEMGGLEPEVLDYIKERVRVLRATAG